MTDNYTNNNHLLKSNDLEQLERQDAMQLKDFEDLNEIGGGDVLQNDMMSLEYSEE